MLENLAEEYLQDISRANRQRSEQLAPSAEDILSKIEGTDREQIVLWLLQVCGMMHIDDGALFLAVLLLDRFCAASEGAVSLETLHLITMAVVSTALKANGASSWPELLPQRSLRDILTHIGQQRVTAQQIFLAEVAVLEVLAFDVTVPTPLDFFDSLVSPFLTPGRPEQMSPVWCVGKFMLTLSLFDATIHYRYSHDVLAAGAMYMALWCNQASASQVEAMFTAVPGHDPPPTA